MDCVDHLMDLFGLSQQQAVDLMTEVQKERAALGKNIGDIGKLTEKLYNRLQNRTQRAALEAAAHKRALTLQYAKRLELFDMITTKFQGIEEEGISAILVGSNRVRDGARLSVDAQQTALRGYYIGGLLSDLQKLDNDGMHLKLLQKGAMDRSVAQALWTIDNPNAQQYGGPKEGMAIAQVIHKWQEKAREDANLSGAWIDKMPGYIVRQSHDRARISSAGFDKWKQDMMNLLDWNETGEGRLITDQQKTAFLDEVYKNLVLARIPDRPGNPLAGRFGNSRIGSAANKASQQRVLHFKDADAWYDYNMHYGRSNMREAIIDGLSSMANNTAMMRRLGPSPSAQVDALYGMLERVMRNSHDEKGIQRLQAYKKAISNQLKEVDGTLNTEQSPTLAAVGRNIRALQSMAKLGGAMISGFSDAPVFSSEMAYQGQGFFKALVNGIADLLHGRGTKEQQEILSQLGVFFDGMCGDVTARVSGDETPGMMTKMQNMFFKLNGLTWWTDSWRRAAGMMMSHELALQKSVSWMGLHQNLRRVLGQYGIGPDEWDLFRLGSEKMADGREYLTPEGIKDVDAGLIMDYMVNHGKASPQQQISARMVESTRAELEDMWRTYFRDRINYAVLEPDAKTRSKLRQGTSAGTVPGELLRFATQFKSFPASYVQKVLGREIYGRAGDSRGNALRAIVDSSEKGEMIGSLARLILMTTLFGYGSMTVKDLLKGRTPRDPSDPATWTAAFVQGGGAGIYGDFLFGEYNRFGNSLASSIAGPAAGTLSDIANIWARVRDGDSAAQAILRVLINNTPGNGLFYIRGPFDYLIGYNLYEMINPGYFKRQKRRVERENNQTFFMSPVKW